MLKNKNKQEFHIDKCNNDNNDNDYIDNIIDNDNNNDSNNDNDNDSGNDSDNDNDFIEESIWKKSNKLDIEINPIYDKNHKNYI